MRKKKKFFYLFTGPGFVGILIFVLLPFGDVVKRSFTGAVTGHFTGMKNYQIIFTNQAFVLAVKNTIGFTLVCIPLLVLAGFVTAVLLNGLGGRGRMKSVYLFPLAMPTATIVMVWKMIFYKPHHAEILYNHCIKTCFIKRAEILV